MCVYYFAIKTADVGQSRCCRCPCWQDYDECSVRHQDGGLLKADVLAPNRRLAIINHHSDFTMIKNIIVIHECTMHYTCYITDIKQTLLKRGVEVVNPSFSLLLVGSSFHNDNALWMIYNAFQPFNTQRPEAKDCQPGRLIVYDWHISLIALKPWCAEWFIDNTNYIFIFYQFSILKYGR